jgi:hypothetical protein
MEMPGWTLKYQIRRRLAGSFPTLESNTDTTRIMRVTGIPKRRLTVTPI